MAKTLNEIRTTFLKYFEKNDHKIVDSSNLVPNNDPTLMFANSGMVQFKNVFTGLEKRDYQRATTSQKCVRAGGKHNDLENVGYTPRHHTFFEMLGNFSFGDYFKEKAISLAWDLITKEFGINKDKLYVTVFKEDDDAFNLWKKVAGLNESKVEFILGLGKKQFFEMLKCFFIKLNIKLKLNLLIVKNFFFLFKRAFFLKKDLLYFIY